jgi:hypothetical protein
MYSVSASGRKRRVWGEEDGNRQPVTFNNRDVE